MRVLSFSLSQNILCFAIVVLAGTAFQLSGQAPEQKSAAPKAAPSPAVKTAEQQFKNIQILKGIPADQLIPSMQFISASLGVDCEYCHVEQQMDKDDKKAKVVARKMMTMMFEINADSFEGERKVTCNSCHHGSPHPASTPPVALGTSAGGSHEHEDDPANPTAQPKASDVLDKYLAAVGGAEALQKIHSRVQKGNLETMGITYPIEVYSLAPNKRISVSHPPNVESVTAYNGEVGWLTLRGSIHRMNSADAAAARLDAELYFPMRVREMYTSFEVRAGEPIAGHPTVMLAATGEGYPPVELYFDAQSGLLVRLVRYLETPLGRNPTQIDYADYRVVDGVKIPYQWTVARPRGAFTIKIDKAEQNVPVDQELFVAPAQPPPAPAPAH